MQLNTGGGTFSKGKLVGKEYIRENRDKEEIFLPFIKEKILSKKHPPHLFFVNFYQ